MSILLAAGCSWVAARAIDSDPTAESFDYDHVEDLAFVKKYSFAGLLQQKLGLDNLHIVAEHGSNNEEQIERIVNFVNQNTDADIFVLWGITSIYRWRMYSTTTGKVESCMVGRTFNTPLDKEVKYYFKHHWDKDTEIKKLNEQVVWLDSYLTKLGIDHLFFNAFQSYNNQDDMLQVLCRHANVTPSTSSVPWLNLSRDKNTQFNSRAVKELQTQGWLDCATAHPTVKAHQVIAEELYKLIEGT
jgi:hypothetical protein